MVLEIVKERIHRPGDPVLGKFIRKALCYRALRLMTRTRTDFSFSMAGRMCSWRKTRCGSVSRANHTDINGSASVDPVESRVRLQRSGTPSGPFWHGLSQNSFQDGAFDQIDLRNRPSPTLRDAAGPSRSFSSHD